MHIDGDRNYWGDLLSRRLTVPLVSVSASAVYAASTPDKTFPSKQVIRDAQQASRANLGTCCVGYVVHVDQVSLDDERLFRLPVNERAVLWIPGGATQLQVRLIACAHTKKADHRGAAATLQRLSEYCWCFCMQEHVAKFVKQRLHSMDSLKRGRRCLSA